MLSEFITLRPSLVFLGKYAEGARYIKFLCKFYCTILIEPCMNALEECFQETSYFGTKTIIRCNEPSFVGHIMQTIYVFVYQQINQNKFMSGMIQYSKRKVIVLVPK